LAASVVELEPVVPLFAVRMDPKPVAVNADTAVRVEDAAYLPQAEVEFEHVRREAGPVTVARPNFHLESAALDLLPFLPEWVLVVRLDFLVVLRQGAGKLPIRLKLPDELICRELCEFVGLNLAI